MTSMPIPAGGFGGQPQQPQQPQQPRQPQQPQGGFGGGFQPTRQRFNPMPQQGFGGFGGFGGGFGMPQQQQGFGGFGGFGGGYGMPQQGFGGFGGFGMPQQQGFGGFGGFGGYGMPQQQQGFGGFGGGYGMSQQGGFGQITPQQMQPMVQPTPPQQQLGQITPEQMRVMSGAPRVGGQQNSPARQSFEQFIASGGPRGGGAGFFNALQGYQASPQEEQAANVMQQYRQQQLGQSPMDQMQPMVQPRAPQQAEQAIPQIAGAPLDKAQQYQKEMRQRYQQRMGQISGNPYSQQLGQEDRRMEAMRKLQQMNLGG